MQITKIGQANTKNNNYQQNSENKIGSSHKTNYADKVSFGMDPITAAILNEAASASAWGILGRVKLEKVFEKAHSLFDKYDVKPAIETAISLDAKYNNRGDGFFDFLGSFFDPNTNGLLGKALMHAKKLSDFQQVEIDLKRRLLDHCFLDKKHVYDDLQSPIIELFNSLNNRTHGEFKKYVLSRYVSQGKFELICPDNPCIKVSAVDGIDDKTFSSEIYSKASRLQQDDEREFRERAEWNEGRNNPIG